MYKVLDKIFGYSSYRRKVQFIQWCKQASMTPGHELENPKLRMIRECKERATQYKLKHQEHG